MQEGKSTHAETASEGCQEHDQVYRTTANQVAPTLLRGEYGQSQSAQVQAQVDQWDQLGKEDAAAESAPVGAARWLQLVPPEGELETEQKVAQERPKKSEWQ